MTIRDARPEDAGAIAEISLVALGYASTAGDTRRRLIAALKTPGQFLRVAVDDAGRVTGFIHACDYATLYFEPLKYVMMLAVNPTVQGQGVGRALLDACEAWAKATGAAGVRLASGADREGAHAFYQHLGYVVRKDQKSIWKVF